MIYNHPSFYFHNNFNPVNRNANNFKNSNTNINPRFSSKSPSFANPYHSANTFSSSNYNLRANENNKPYEKNNHSNSCISKLENFKEKKTSLQGPKLVIEFLGIKFYYDDILLICLIFFLYKENVKDNYLFFALILLLLN